MKAFIGIRTYMSVVSLPEVAMFWNRDWLFGGMFIRNVMTRDRFDKISQYLHVNNTAGNPARGQPGHDPLKHVRNVHDMVLEKCLTLYNPHQQQSIDEAMIAFRGRLSFRQYLPAKPTKYGLKVWCRCDPSDGYLNEFQIYTGRVAGVGREQGQASRVVKDLTQKIQGNNHVINADTFSHPRRWLVISCALACIIGVQCGLTGLISPGSSLTRGA